MELRDWLPWNWNWSALRTLDWRRLLPWRSGGSSGEVLLRAPLPGVPPEDVRVEVRGDRVLVAAARRFEDRREDSGYALRRLSQVGVVRSFRLPPGVDPASVEARLRHGMLEVVADVAAAGPRRIPVRAA